MRVLRILFLIGASLCASNSTSAQSYYFTDFDSHECDTICQRYKQYTIDSIDSQFDRQYDRQFYRQYDERSLVRRLIRVAVINHIFDAPKSTKITINSRQYSDNERIGSWHFNVRVTEKRAKLQIEYRF